MKKTVVAILLLVFLASCGKDSVFIKARFSVLGDSYSAFEGYVDPDSNKVWWGFPTIGVTGPELMWWSLVADETGWTLEKNNSYSASLICNMEHEGYSEHSYIRRMNNLGNPDVIFIFGGTNDVFDEVPLGDYIYANWTEEQLCMFRPALAYLLDQMQQIYPDAKLCMLIDMDLCSGGVDVSVRDAFIESMHVVANHYHVKCIDLNFIIKQKWHPNVDGQQSIATQILDAFLKDNDYLKH
ncbi:MAG: hypothetical protein IJG41_07610 [Bacteroidales bacterium]|jgi:hypothetical protein|nr:hypothetical protein [Bacteroidales bacterium]